ncbi:MAG: sensor histidine kinase [Lachnospiraceae bacterium]
MAELLNTIICAFIIAMLFFLSWYRLTDKLMEQHSQHRWMLFIAVSSVIQVGANIVLIYVDLGRYRNLSMSTFFILQGIIMWRILYSRVNPAKAICSIALSFFFMNSTIYILDYYIHGSILNLVKEAGLNYFIYLIAIDILSILEHIAVLVFSILVGKLIEKLRFSSYYGNLFSHPVRGWGVCVISLILMQSHYLFPALFPALDTSAVYLAMSFIGGAIVLFTILAVSVFETNRDKVKMQEEFIAQQQIYVQTLEGLQQDFRAFRHDYQNLLSGMYLQASQGNTEELQKTLQNTLYYFDDRLGNQIKRVTELSRILVTEVKSLLLIKLARAENLRVNMTLEVTAQVDRIDMNMGDFVRCLGILLDNAMEAATEQKEPVRVAFIQDHTGLTVIVANPFHQQPQLHRLGEGGYTTKGEGHGMGLSSYKALTGQYENVFVLTNCLNKIFRQELQIRRQL